MKKTKLCVMADSVEPKRGRTCFWPELAEVLSNVSITVDSFPDARAQPRFIDFREYDAIIFNWDVLNNDPWVRGEVTYAMTTRAARTFLPTWVRDGGLLILEAQCSHWAPLQDAYEAILPGCRLKVRGYRFYEAKAGTAFRVESRHAAHPFLWRLSPDVDYTCAGEYWNRPWFPSWYSGHASIFDSVKQRTHSGSFVSNGPEWLPLLICSQTGLPIMLVSVHGKGAIVATTMHLASSGQTQLVANLLGGWSRGEQTESLVNLTAYHQKAALGSKLRYWTPRVVPQIAVFVGLYWFGFRYYSHLAGGALGFFGFWIASLLGSKYYNDLAGVFKSNMYKLSRRFR